MNSIDQLDISCAMMQLHGGKHRPSEICQELADRCADLLEQGDDRALQCLQFIADTHEFTESAMIRTAIESCFIHRLGTRIFRSVDHASLVKLLPENLHQMLVAQLNTSGI